MSEVIVIVVALVGGLIVGVCAGFFGGRAAGYRETANRIVEAEAQIAKAEATLQEVRSQHQIDKDEMIELRTHLSAAEAQKVEAETQLRGTVKALDEQKTILAGAQREFTTAFEALADRALKSNSQTFLDLAKTSFASIHAEAKGELAQHQQAIENLLKPLDDALKRYEDQILNMEKERQSAYGGLDVNLKLLAEAHARLQRETGNLVTALRSPQVRGRWGELTLKRVAELAGMVQHCDFFEQEMTGDAANRQRPDMIVQLPNNRRIVVDAKTVLSAYLEAVEAQDDATRDEKMREHTNQVRSRLNELSSKAYWNQIPDAPEFVVLFLPGEQFLGAALDHDRTLIEDGFAKGVVLATPTTLVALLKTVAYGWRQEALAENAQAISTLGKDVFERLALFIEHLEDVGASLTNGVTSYNKAVRSLEGRLLPAARKFKEMGISSEKGIGQLESIEQVPQKLSKINPP